LIIKKHMTITWQMRRRWTDEK